jgi:hypothetical protein
MSKFSSHGFCGQRCSNITALAMGFESRVSKGTCLFCRCHLSEMSLKLGAELGKGLLAQANCD